MDVLVLRHGIALSREEAAVQSVSDRDRPLTSKGRERIKKVARFLAKQVPNVVSLYASPLRRGIETAEIVRKAYGDLHQAETPALLPEAEPVELSQFLNESTSAAVVVVVGHEPQLTRWVGWSLTGEPRPISDLRKGGACLIRFEDSPGPATGRLLWLLSPSLMRGL